MILTRTEAIEKLNQYGKSGQPTFFFTDFPGEQCWIGDHPDVLWELQGMKNHEESARKLSSFHFKAFPKPPESFEVQFRKVVEEIKYGNSFLVNLTLKTPIRTSLSLKDIFLGSKAKYKVLFNDRFVVFSPETFIEIKDDRVYSHPMKGTIDAAIPSAEKIILNDKKETAEHITIVDLIRNDLSHFASDVQVTRFRYIEKIATHAKHLLQVSSEISGKMNPNWQESLGSILFSLLPAGSISGAPKPSTVRIIQETEDYKRGFYTGICGYFDGKNLDTGVMIRFIEKEGDQLYFKSGGGITSFSNLDAEYQEVIDKIYVPVH